MSIEEVALKPIIFKDFITEEEQVLFLKWANDIVPVESLSNGQRFAYADENPSPDLFWEVRTRIADLLQIDDIVEPRYKSIVSIGSGNALPGHIDLPNSGLEDYRHVRANVFLTMPDGSEPVVDGKRYTVYERGLLVFTPDVLMHSHDAYSGNNHRVILSYGFVVVPGNRLFGNTVLPWTKLQPVTVGPAAMGQRGKYIGEVFPRQVWVDSSPIK